MTLGDELREGAASILARMTGSETGFRPGQWEAISALVEERRKVLLVQRTGWGKSAVYLLATRLLRDRGSGPTLIVSPLLALMRNQIEMADRSGIRATTINSTNRSDWDVIEAELEDNRVDLLLISPERLNNPEFVADLLPGLLNRLGLLVVDEVHCISDWGHDFRPDYRRLARLVESLPPGTSVLGTTATANDRVIEDVVEQFGAGLLVERGTLDRESLALQVIDLPDAADRLAWLAHVVPSLRGSGIVYCLTIRDAEAVGAWLAGQGISAEAYTGQADDRYRMEVEERLSRGEVKVVAATSALGMGYDNPFIEFVIHYQSPGSPISYYQQVGRAGRAVDYAFGILLTGEEDQDIQDYFIDSAFPTEAETSAILESVATAPQTLTQLEAIVNLQRSRIMAFLKILEVEGALYREDGRWHRSAQLWTYPGARIAAITAARRREQEAMLDYSRTTSCLMEYLRRQLDDPEAGPCGRCANCLGKSLLPTAASEELVIEALAFLRRTWVEITPRKLWPAGSGLPSLRQAHNQEGRALCRWGDPGWGKMIAHDKNTAGRVRDELVAAVVELVESWDPQPRPTWVTSVPDRAGRDLVSDFARRLADRLELPYLSSLRRVADRRQQKKMQNSAQQFRNVEGAFAVGEVRPEPVLLVDDMVDSGWTFTYLGFLLREAGATEVYPLALADTSRRRE